MTPRQQDLVGCRFGNLTVVAPIGVIDHQTAWKCRCICGNEIVVKRKYLVGGKRTHCGCLSRRMIDRLQYVDGTCIEMLKSKKKRSNNRSGYTGVFFDKTHNKWRAEIMMQGKRHCLGRFETLDEAITVRKNAETDLHDRFVREYEERQYQNKESAHG